MGKKTPIHEIRLGLVRVAIWQNEKEDGEVWFNSSPTRLYKEEGSNWKEATTFRRDDLPILSKVLDMAYEWILKQDMVTPEGKQS